MFALPNWGFRNTVHAHHGQTPVQLPLIPLSNKTSNSTSPSSVPLDEFVRTRIPELKDGAKHLLKPYLFSGTLQTLYTFKADFNKQYPVYFGREIIDITKEEIQRLAHDFTDLNEGQFTLDYVVDPPEEELDDATFKAKYKETLPEGYPRLHPRCRYYTAEEINAVKESWKSDDQPISVIVPGLAGGIQEAPVRATCYKLHKQGHHVVVLNQRGCSRSKITTPFLYTGLSTDDLKYILMRLHHRYDGTDRKSDTRRQFHAIGYSFGGLQITNYLAKEGKNSKLTSAITVSSPWDLNESMNHVSSSLSGHYLFEPSITFFLMRLVKNNLAVLSENPDIFTVEKYEALKKRIKHTCEFDDEFTCKLLGLPSGRIYYNAASPFIRMYNIKTPLLVINSSDDPMISTDFPHLDVARHPWIYMATADLGGHYSFIQSNGDFWFAGVIERWIEAWKEVAVQTPHDVEDGGWNVKHSVPYV